jgi:alpha-L-fucosidase
MNRLVFSLIALGVLIAGGSQTSGQQKEQIDNWDMLTAKPEVVQQWQDMRFGMFLCWGPVTLTGKEIGWSRQAPDYGKERGFRCALRPRPDATPTDVYDRLYTQWKPDKFDARQWVRVAKDAGCHYLIFLVKHHDGFCLHDTKLTDYKSTGPESAWKVDVMKAVADACHKADLKLIIYYSQPDWHHPDYLGEYHERYVEYLHGQIRELLTDYGRIDGLWFDNLRPISPETARLWDAEKLFKLARSIQPHLIINNRCGLPGDYDTPEQTIGHFQSDRPWESCCTLGTQWAWKPDDAIKSFEECIRMLVGCAVGDGNLALNTNPMPDGRIEPRQADRYREIGRWMEKYGESIYGTRGGPFVAAGPARRWSTRDGLTLPPGAWWGGSTHKGDVAYLHILRWPADTIRLPGIGCRIVNHVVLTGGEAVVHQTEEGIEIAVPEEQRNSVDTIVKLQFDRSLAGVEPVGGPDKVQLPPGYTASASGEWPDPKLDAALAFDGDFGTRWGGAPNTTTGWLAIDLGKPTNVNRVVINEGDWDRVRKFDLQYKQEETWKTIVSGTTLGPEKCLDFDPVEAQHFRLNILEATNVPTIWEFQLFPVKR